MQRGNRRQEGGGAHQAPLTLPAPQAEVPAPSPTRVDGLCEHCCACGAAIGVETAIADGAVGAGGGGQDGAAQAHRQEAAACMGCGMAAWLLHQLYCSRGAQAGQRGLSAPRLRRARRPASPPASPPPGGPPPWPASLVVREQDEHRGVFGLKPTGGLHGGALAVTAVAAIACVPRRGRGCRRRWRWRRAAAAVSTKPSQRGACKPCCTLCTPFSPCPAHLRRRRPARQPATA